MFLGVETVLPSNEAERSTVLLLLLLLSGLVPVPCLEEERFKKSIVPSLVLTAMASLSNEPLPPN